MQWYEGSIPAAIAEAKEKKKIFLVYIEGKDELSKQMTATYDDKVVSERLENEGCVSIKLEADSESCKQFSQIYPICIIPSSFFIGNDGIPLEVIAGNLEPENFLSKVDKVIKLHSEQATDDQSKTKKENQDACGSGAIPKETHMSSAGETHMSSAGETHMSSAGETHMSAAGLNTDTTSTASLNTDTTSTYSLTTYQVSTATQEKNSEDDVEMSSPTSAPEEEVKQSTSSQADAEEFEQKVKRARRLIEDRNVQKEQEEQQKENEKEVERRKSGKELQKSQRQRELNELQEWAQDRAKEKEEERIAREKVLAQIAQDRAERAARYQQSIKKKSPEQQTTDGERKSEQDKATTDALSRSQFANIQFRLPDGTSVIHQFSADSTLEEAQQYINENIKPGYSHFTLSTTFPRREFTTNDYSQTLRDLQLVPSSTVLILPVHSITRSDGGGLAALLWSVLSPFAVIWGYITSFFSSSNSSNSASTSSNSSAPQQTTSTNDNDKRAEGDSKTIPRRNFYHQEGNVYRLSNQQGDDDDNNTWNGNSTQQM